jgi:hypothetical protein
MPNSFSSVQNKVLAAFAVCVPLALVFGCGGDPLGRHAISGAVTVDGAPLQRGNVGFQPIEKTSTTSGGAVVMEGKYSVPRDKGLPTGKYRVRINAAASGAGGEAQSTAPPGAPAPPPQELIPPEWNENSEHTIEVTEKGPFVFNFEVQTKKK